MTRAAVTAGQMLLQLGPPNHLAVASAYKAPASKLKKPATSPQPGQISWALTDLSNQPELKYMQLKSLHALVGLLTEL